MGGKYGTCWKSRWRSLGLFLAVIGPGLVTANADNDAGGITTYTQAGALYGYKMLFGILIITFGLAVIQEMAARMGAVTGKGLSDLIREEFGVRWTVLAMAVLLVANMAVTVAEFAGIAASYQVFGLGGLNFLLVPLTAALLWLLVVKGSYRLVERAFLALSLVFAAYVVSGLRAGPDWGQVARHLLIPHFEWSPGFITMFIGVIGTTITPWMQFYLQSSVVDKGITAEHYRYERVDVIFGAFLTDFVSFFIIVSAAAAIYFSGGPRVLETPAMAAQALRWVAGPYAAHLFAGGLFGASVLAAPILPLTTSYAICEAFGWESGIDRRYGEAPVFYGLFTLMIAAGAGVVLLPWVRRNLVQVMLFSQFLNGLLVPVIMIFMLRLVNNRRLMGRHVNGRVYNLIAWTTVGGIILLTVAMLVTMLFRS
ncbi:MAG: Nramp family divalent metal transporter [Bacteroidota bacterium]